MEHGCTNLNEAVRSVRLLKFDGYCATKSSCGQVDYYTKSSWNVDGHEFEVRFYPVYEDDSMFDSIYDKYDCYDPPLYGDDICHCVYSVALELILVSAPPRNTLRTNLSCRLVDPSRNLGPSQEKSLSHVFYGPGQCSSKLVLVTRDEVASSGYIVNDSLTVECTITVLKDLSDTPTVTEATPPSSDLHRHLGELLLGQTGADVTFVLDSGERFPAHKNILAARSPVFMAEFFDHMNERSSQCVRIEDMETAVFKAMLHFIYTDTAPELEAEEAAATMAQHLLAAADRYGLERLKLICEGKLSVGIDVDTAATTLALAEQHNCSLLKAKCVDFIAGSPETLDAVVATEGYRHLVESCPLVLTELLKAAHGRRN